MTTLQLADNIFPSLNIHDTVAKSIKLMNEYKTTHLPVVSEGKFAGLIADEDLSDAENKKSTLDTFQANLIPAAVNQNFHFLKASSVYNLYQTNLVAVVNDSNELSGTISSAVLVTALGNLCGSSEFGAMIVLEIERSRYAISEINSIIESDGATILHLNVSPMPVSDLIEVTLQINKKEIATIVATFERYDYSISYYSGEELFENEISTNYHNLMNYLAV